MLTKVSRPTLDDIALAPGKRARLHRLLYEFGPGNGQSTVVNGASGATGARCIQFESK